MRWLFTQGDRGDFFYVIESGVFHVMVNGAHVHTYEVDEEQRVYPTFGELALMYAKPRAASVVANTRGKLWKLGRSGFRQARKPPTLLTPTSPNLPCLDLPGPAALPHPADHPLRPTLRYRTVQVQTLASTAVTDPTKLLRKVEIFSALRYSTHLALS